MPNGLFGSGFQVGNCSHTFGLIVQCKAAGPDGMSWLTPNHLDGLLMSYERIRLNQPRFYLCGHHFENACAIGGVW
jgi:hypothetical protein